MNLVKTNNFFPIYKNEFDKRNIIKNVCLVFKYYFVFVIYKDGSLEASKI